MTFAFKKLNREIRVKSEYHYIRGFIKLQGKWLK